MQRHALIGILLILLGSFTAAAGEIEPALEEVMRAASPQDKFSVIAGLYSPRDIRALDQQLHEAKATLAERHYTVIEALKANARDTQGPVLSSLALLKKSGLVEGYTPYWIDNLIVLYGTAEAIFTLADDPAVEWIGPNFKAVLIEPVRRGPRRPYYPHRLDDELTTPGQDAVGATRVNRELGLTGEGVLVANLDTGVDGDHPALDWRWRGNHASPLECWLDVVGSPSLFPQDYNSHGTHTMGTICGREIDGTDTITVGGAPDAEWIACNAIDQGVSPGFTQDVIDAFQWFADPDENSMTMDDVPDVIQNSWGVTTYHVETHCYFNWNGVILDCEAAGPVITWSAGNEGPNAESLRSPATYELNHWQIFSIGAVNSTDYGPPYPIADFSSRGPSGCDPDVNAIKPEVVAPGVEVFSSVPGGGYEQDWWDGTSMAGPHVAGIVALMRQACPDCDAQTIKEAIMNTAIDYGATGEDNTYGHGFLNGYEAVMAVYSLGRVEGIVTDDLGAPLSEVCAEALGANRVTMTDADGYYCLAVSEGTYDVRFSKFGYETVVEEDVAVLTEDTTTVNITLYPTPSRILAGTVTSQNGIPWQNAIVVIENTPIDTLYSDGNGLFTQELPATTYDIHVEYLMSEYQTLLELDTNVTIETVTDTTHVLFILVNPYVAPIGPDGYGYYAYDRYDAGLPAAYDWVELNPFWLGPGTPFTQTNFNSSVAFKAPFPLRFYGQDFDSITVSNNGWISPGVWNVAAEINQPLPDTEDPAGMIAPFWDNLRSGGDAEQFAWYDGIESGRWVLQFDNQKTVIMGNRLYNWQVQILDPAFHPTVTGDAEILFLYGLMQVPDACTVGLESPDEQTGIQVLLNGDLHELAWPIEDGAAIRFTTGRGDGIGTITGTVSLYPEPDDPSSTRIVAAGQEAFTDASGAFTVESVMSAPVSAVMIREGYEYVRQTDIPVPVGSSVDIAFEAWRLDPPRNPDITQYDGVVTLTWDIPESVELYPNDNVTYNVYRRGELWRSGLTELEYSRTYPNGALDTFQVQAVYPGGLSGLTEEVDVVVDLPVEENRSELPEKFALHQNFPNPFNPSTQIQIDLPEAVDFRLTIYDITGRQVRTLYQGRLAAGYHRFNWDSRSDGGAEVAAGIYFCRMSSREFTASRKMLLVK